MYNYVFLVTLRSRRRRAPRIKCARWSRCSAPHPTSTRRSRRLRTSWCSRERRAAPRHSASTYLHLWRAFARSHCTSDPYPPTTRCSRAPRPRRRRRRPRHSPRSRRGRSSRRPTRSSRSRSCAASPASRDITNSGCARAVRSVRMWPSGERTRAHLCIVFQSSCARF